MKAIVRGVCICVGGILVLLGLGVVFVVLQLDGWSRKGLEYQLARILGAPVTIEGITAHPLDETLDLRGVIISNPDPFDAGTAVHLPQIRVAFDPMSLFREKLVLPEVVVQKAQVNFHYLPGTGSNLQVLAANARAWHESPRLLGRRAFVVERLDSRGASLTTHALGRSVTVPLGDVSRKDVGSEQVRSVAYMSALVLHSLLGEIVSAQSVMEGIKESLE